MSRRFSIMLSAFALVLIVSFSTAARADEWDQKTMFSVNQPVTIPGHVVLPAGTYVIKRLDAVNPILQILNGSETKVYATVKPVPETVAEPFDSPMFTFKEMPLGSPIALKSFFYPGRLTGYEFVDKDEK